MKKKIVKNCKYQGLGFPVVLREVEVRDCDGQWIPKVNSRKIAEDLIKSTPSGVKKLKI